MSCLSDGEFTRAKQLFYTLPLLTRFTNMLIEVVWIVASFAFVLLCQRWYFHKLNLPPGPLKLPVIGSLLSVLAAGAKRPVDLFEKLTKSYGNVVSLQMGSIPTVLISGHAKLAEVANSEFLLSRIDENDVWILEKSKSYPLGILFSLPDFWTQTRGYTHKVLNKYGFSDRSTIGTLVAQEFTDFCDEIHSQMKNGEVTITLTTQFNLPFFKTIWRIVTGEKCSRDDICTQSLLHDLNAYIKSGNYGESIAFIFPKLISIFPKWTGFQNLRDMCAKWRATTQDTIRKERGELSYDDKANNFLQEILHAVDKTGPVANVHSSIFTDENVVAVVQDLCLGGMDTGSHLVKFLIRYLLQYPEIQNKLLLEIDEVVGRSRNATADDIPRLLYTQATLYELYRLANVVPVIARKLLKNWKLDNYLIPKGTLIILNMWSGNLDDSFWKDASTFNPDRFLSANGQLINTDKIVSFGFGRRRCIGKQFGKTSMLFSVITLLQRFRFEIDPIIGPPSDEDIHSFTRDTVRFNVVLRAR